MNKMDMMDVEDRGTKKAKARHQQAEQNWNQVDTEIQIGKLMEKIKAAGVKMPAGVMKQMEAIYGEN